MMVACMFVLRVLTGAHTLPELFEDQVLAFVPGALFSFALDRLQFVAKPLLLVGLALMAVPLGAILGWLLHKTWHRQWQGRAGFVGGIAYGLILWLVLEAAVAAWGDGPTAAINGAGLLLASAETFGISLVVLGRFLDLDANEGPVDERRRRVVFGGVTAGALVLAGGGLARMLALNTEQPTAGSALPQADAAANTIFAPAPTGDAASSLSSEEPTRVAIPPGVTEEITSNERFYVVSKNFNDPRVSADRWSLEIAGLIDQPRQFSHEEILAFPTVSQYTTLECISNTLGGQLMSNAYWTGVPLSQLLASVGVQPEARAIIFRSADNYYESFPLEVVLADGVLLAHTMNGAPLPDKHGFPLRLILPGRYGMKNPKWIVKIEVVADRIDGYWVRRGWDREAPVQTVARIDTPTHDASVDGPRLEVAGVAFASSRGISRVEASLDGGATWREAQTRPPLGSSTWVQWVVDWEDVPSGAHDLLARATDGTGGVQAPDRHEPFPSGATGYHRAMINVRG
jgi:DMSO/TMAO reductase YedYZ molybdopterin-dependent catalytic subunit